MNRRQFLALAATTAVAGCGENAPGRGTPPQAPLPPVTLSAVDTTVENPEVSLRFVYNWAVQSEIPLDSTTRPNPGNKWLVLRADVTNRGESSQNLSADQYVIRTAEGAYSFTLTLTDWALVSKQAAPGETVTGWLVFQIPSPVTEATLAVTESAADDHAITFSQDTTLDAAIPE